MHLEPEELAGVGEEQQVVVGAGDEEVLDPVVLLEVGAVEAAPAAALLLVGGDRDPLDVAGVGDGDDHVLFGDQVLDRELALVADDLGAALVAERVPTTSAISSLRIAIRFGLRAEDALAAP